MADRKPLLDPQAAAFLRGEEASPPPAAPVPAAAPLEPQEEARTRFTVDLPRSLHRRLKQAALDGDQSMSDLVRGALSEWLLQRP
jgi:hypothetical protein